LACCINAATLALLEGGVAMKEMVAACSVAYMDNTVVLVRLLRHMT
jgi:ribonuclease PH